MQCKWQDGWFEQGHVKTQRKGQARGVQSRLLCSAPPSAGFPPSMVSVSTTSPHPALSFICASMSKHACFTYPCVLSVFTYHLILPNIITTFKINTTSSNFFSNAPRSNGYCVQRGHSGEIMDMTVLWEVSIVSL